MVQASDVSAPRTWPRMTYEEYLCDPTIPECSEWVDGEVVEMMSVSPQHARLVAYLMHLLQAYFDEHPLGEVLGEPFNMKTGPELPGRSPDLIVILNEHAGRIGSKNLEGAADLVIEVISPGTESTDRGRKFYEYETGGVSEYWLLDPIREVAEFYLRDDRGVFRAAPLSAAGEFASVVMDGLRIRPQWLWSRRRVRDVLRDLGIE